MGIFDVARPALRLCMLSAFLAASALPSLSAGTEKKTPAPAAEAQKSPAAESGQLGAVKSTHGAWSIVCDTPAGANSEQCVLMQNVLSEDRPELGLSVVVLKTADRKARILRVLAPLGVLLLPPKGGLGLNVDGKNLGNAYFARCFADGCYAEVTLEDDLLKTLRSGQLATFVLHESVEQDGIGIPVDLTGFAEGYDKLP